MKNQEDIKQILDNVEIQIQKLKMYLSDDIDFESAVDYSKVAESIGTLKQGENERIIEGVFDGQKMIGPDGKQYYIPANYISKSKLVEGDILKLTIDAAGNFIYKQIGPVDRDRLVGLLLKTEDGEYVVKVEDVVYKVILASVTYFKGDEGDEAVILVPKGTTCQWAAVENIIKKK
jgi:hypothetical protein